jgi:hypothetical protein
MEQKAPCPLEIWDEGIAVDAWQHKNKNDNWRIKQERWGWNRHFLDSRAIKCTLTNFCWSQIKSHRDI